MYGVIPYPYYKKLMKYRGIAYTIIIVFGLLAIFSSPVTAHADMFGYYVPDVYDEITENVSETNDILNKAFTFSQTSPYEIVNTLRPASSTGIIAIRIREASKTLALVVATLLLMVDFFRKSINFEWSSKWENVLIFLIKILVIKQVVQNADTIVGYIYSMFDSVNKAATGSSPSYLPCGNMTTYTATVEQGLIKQISKGWWDFWYDFGAGNVYDTYTYKISPEAVKMFFPDATFPSTTAFSDIDTFTDAFPSPTEKINFFPTIEKIKLWPYYLILKAIAYIVFVIVIGRVFELAVYTLLAPLPLATFASETTHDVAKNFLKNYIAVVLQVTVMVVMFIVYVATNSFISNWITANNFGSIKMINLIALFALGLGIMKSGAWSKKICGIG
ncbi:hypothetical protein [Ruminococcus sp.]|uniref:hypothetical protein n=1 Tax=Ruminococcus sp. TaxID=41978 RepID=UPI002BF543B5|nr:hypothetical protein [Ruminococcus sp.]HOA00018.1 hypothetical protein [Ruminococcus sp.]